MYLILFNTQNLYYVSRMGFVECVFVYRMQDSYTLLNVFGRVCLRQYSDAFSILCISYFRIAAYYYFQLLNCYFVHDAVGYLSLSTITDVKIIM